MLNRYSQIIYVPKGRDRFSLVPQRHLKWALLKHDICKALAPALASASSGLCEAAIGTATAIKNCWNWLQEKASPTPNPFDLAWKEMVNELIFEGA